jgi:hypothetical protein
VTRATRSVRVMVMAATGDSIAHPGFDFKRRPML